VQLKVTITWTFHHLKDLLAPREKKSQENIKWSVTFLQGKEH